ncbi:MAG: branched-chain amino acid aminotransferase [Thermoanaerobaculales bacterium]|jgi:branched-chain amino acid aminotransferase|nr:branched-chain amino acid aminotransferase [Thermoanaerobaculales bacterium]
MSKPRYYFPGSSRKADLDFAHLGFDYRPCPYRFEAVYRDGFWRVRGLLESTDIQISEGSQCLHYGQQLFEGMKVHGGPDGRVYSFRPAENARRMNEGAHYLCGPEVPEELFIRGIEEVVAANHPYIPPYGSGAALYVRPLYLGIGDNIGVKPARSFVFRIFVSPVGPYFKGGFGPDQGKQFLVSRLDRAAPMGSGHVKAGGNYACSFSPGREAKDHGFAEALYLDPREHRYIEEIGAANFLGFTKSALVTPDSASVLRSITRISLLEIAKKSFGWATEERKIALEELDEMASAACCGTAAVICWINRIVDGDREWTFPFDDRWQKLHDTLVGIQNGSLDDPFGWRHEIPLE